MRKDAMVVRNFGTIEEIVLNIRGTGKKPILPRK